MQMTCYISNEMGGAPAAPFSGASPGARKPRQEPAWAGAQGACPPEQRGPRGRMGERRALLPSPTPTSEESSSRRPREEPSLYSEIIGGLLAVGTCFRLREAQCPAPRQLWKKMKSCQTPALTRRAGKRTSQLWYPGRGTGSRPVCRRVGGPYLRAHTLRMCFRKAAEEARGASEAGRGMVI